MISDFPEEEEEENKKLNLIASQWVDQSCLCNTTPVKTQWKQLCLSEALWLVMPSGVLEGWGPWGHGSSAFDASFPHSLCLIIWLILICIPYNKIAFIIIVLSWVHWVILENYGTCEDNGFVANESVAQVAGELGSLQLVSEVRGVSWRLSSPPERSTLTPGSKHLNYIAEFKTKEE